MYDALTAMGSMSFRNYMYTYTTKANSVTKTRRKAKKSVLTGDNITMLSLSLSFGLLQSIN